MDNPYADRLSPREKEEFASVVRDFEKVWRSPVDHSAADLAAVVERFPANGVLHAALRVELAAIDLGQRLAQDRPASVAAYLEALPGLTGDEIAVRYLIARDYLFHLHRDPNRSPEEHARAFPEQGPELLDALRSAQQSFLDGVEQEAVTHGPFSTALPSDGPRLTAEDKIALPEAPGYKVLDELGAGGMGVVYKSIHLPLNRVVALKMIRVAASREDVARFRGEAEAAARLRHPNIVTVYEVGDFASRDGQPRPYLAMEFLEGGSLAQKLAGRPLPPHQAAELLEALARAVQHAHEARVVHRDLKPGNVLFDSTGQPRVADFGLARLLDRDVQQTGSGAVLGTPSYMAPEQASGRSRKAGPAADVYSLGAILYECLTGRPPFTGATVMDVLQQVLADDPIPPHNLAPKTPRDLETITLKCLNKEPERRYGSARELADDLARFLRGARVLAHPPSLGYRLAKFARRYRGPLSVTAAVLLTAVVGVAAAFVQITAALGRETRAREEADGLRVEAEGKEKQALESLAKEQKALADLKQQFSVVARSYSEISDLEFRRGDVPNSLNWLLQAYETAPAGDPLRPTYRTLLAVQGRSGVRLLRHRDLVLTSAFSPDGRLVLTGSSDHTAQLWETATGRPLATLKHEGGVESVAFSPDGQRVLTASEDKTARLWDAPSGKLIAVLRHQGKVKGVAFSPDGRLALTRSADQTARLWESAGGRESATLRHEGDVNAADFSPDGRLVLTASEDKSAKLWETASGKPRATFRHQGGVRTAAFSPDGRLVLTSSSDLTAGLGETDTGKRIVTLKHEGSLLRPLFSPDGRLLLTGAGPNLAQLWEAATGKPVAVLRHDDVIRDAAFSPNGRAVITGSYDRTARVWLAQTGEHYATLRHEGWVTAVAFSPDRRLALTCDGGNLSKLWDVFTGRLLATRRNHGLVFGGRVSFSPDGRLALTWTLGNTALLWDVVGGAQPVAVLRHAGAVSQVAFSPDGRLALTGGQDKIVHVRDAATGRTLARLEHEAVVNRAAFSPNSQLVVTASRDKKARLWETATGKLRATLPHDDQVKDAAFSPDGRVVATGGEDKKARLWDSSTGKLRATLPHGGAVAKTVFSPDGKLVLIRGDTDQSARLQEVASGKLVAALEHKGVVWSVAFSPDSRLVLTGSQDQTAGHGARGDG
jgi:WD40 repeat protein